MMPTFMGMELQEVWMVVGMALVTWGIRYVMFPVSDHVQLPKLFEQGLRYVPPAVLTAIIVPTVVMPSGNDIDLTLHNPYIIGTAVVCVVGWKTDKLLVTILVGMTAFFLAQWGISLL